MSSYGIIRQGQTKASFFTRNVSRLHARLLHRSLLHEDVVVGRRSVATTPIPLLNRGVENWYHESHIGGSTRFFWSNNSEASISNEVTNPQGMDELNKLLLDATARSDAYEAQENLNRMQEQAVDSEQIHVDSYTAVLNAWLLHQERLSQQPADDNDTTLQEMYHAAECANEILERIQNMPHDEDNLLVTLASIAPPTRDQYDAVLLAWSRLCLFGGASHIVRGVPQRAQRVLEQMEKQYPLMDDPAPYHRVMEAWATSNEHLRGSMAQSVYNRLMKRHDESLDATNGVEPNADTHRIMIRAWCNSKQKRSAFNATGHLKQMQQALKDGVKDMEPSLEDSHLVLDAWTRAEGKLGYRRALSILRSMDDLYISKATDIRPTETSFRLVLEAVAHNSVKVPDLGEWVDLLMDQMEERLMIPDTACFGAAIATWKNSALQQTSSGHEEAMRAHQLLKKMKNAFHQTSTIEVKPNAKHVDMVLEAWSTSDKQEASEKAERLLLQMEQAYEAGDEDMRPSLDSYVWTMYALAKSAPVANKASRAMHVFERFKKAQPPQRTTESSNGSNSSVPAKISADAYNAVLQVCAKATAKDAHSRQDDALQMAFAIFSDMTATMEGGNFDGNGPNSTTYKIMLEACANLLPPGQDQVRALQGFFQNCCRAGLVDKEVLETFRSSVPADVYNQVVVAAGVTEDEAGNASAGKMVPEEWTRNLTYKVLTVDGHKTPPLSVEGMFVITPAMYEYKMRNLRKRKYQRLLRGGRLRR